MIWENEGEKISIPKAISILEKDGIKVNEDQAKIIVDFLTVMANIVVAQYLRRERSD